MVQTVKNAISQEEVNTLLEFFRTEKYRPCEGEMNTRTMDWSQTDWPRDIVKGILDRVLPENYVVDMILMFGAGHGGLQVHTDAQFGGTDKTFLNVSVPLEIQGESACTVFFDNYWYGGHAMFDQAQSMRKGGMNVLINDYSDVVNYKPDTKFDAEIHAKHLNHIDIETLHGLTFSESVPWTIGDAFVANSQQLHSGGVGHEYKIGLTCFVHHDPIK